MEYTDQLARVRRFLNRVHDQRRDRDEYEDDLWSFFQNCWHLKDWVKNDTKVPSEVGARIESDIEKSSVALNICADLANRSKHLTLLEHSSRHDARRGGRKIVAVVNETIRGTEPAQETVRWDYVITLKDGSERLALDVADEAVSDWERLLRQWGLER